MLHGSPGSKHSEGKQDMELLRSFLDVISLWILTCMRQLLYPPYGQGSWEILQRIKCDNRAKRKYTKDYKHIINIYITTETENFADNIQTDRKAWELRQNQMDYFPYCLCEDI